MLTLFSLVEIRSKSCAILLVICARPVTYCNLLYEGFLNDKLIQLRALYLLLNNSLLKPCNDSFVQLSAS